MRDHRLGQPGIEDLQGLLEAPAVLLRPDAGLDQLLRHAAGAADLKPAARQMIEHPDLFENPPWLIEWQHHAHGAEAQPRRGTGDG